MSLSIYPLLGQIVDDTTVEVFSTKTTHYFLEEDIYHGVTQTRSVDTSLNYLHYYNYQYGSQGPFQYLGNLGTAMKPLYYKSPTEIGYRLGFESFHPYLTKQKEQRYFDTRSPYSEMYLLQGGSGEQRLYLLFTRNVNRYWNLGASYNRFTSAKQLSVVQTRDFQADHHQINAFSSVRSNKDKYLALVNFNYMQHWSYESGGIKPYREKTEDIIDSGMFLYKYAYVKLFRTNPQAARNYYKTTNLHLYHQYNPLDSGNTQVQLFHEADWKREMQYFRDNAMLTDSAYQTFYGGIYFGNTNEALYQYKYELFQNKIGLKGKAGNLSYSSYLKNRDYSLWDTSQAPSAIKKRKIWFHDLFGGGTLSYGSSDLTIDMRGEGLLTFNTIRHEDDTNYTNYHDYVLNARVRYKKVVLEVEQIQSAPTLMQTRMVYNLANWTNASDSLKAVLSKRYALSYLHEKGNRLFQVQLAYQRLDNFIYMKITNGGIDSGKVKRIQDKGYMDYLQPSIKFRTNWKKLFVENELILTNVFSDKEVIHMPKWMALPKLYYQSFLFRKATELQAGVELFLKGAYYADGYAPQLNQYYWQDKFSVPTFPITNVFVNFKISRARVFIRATNLFGDPNFQTGYFETPYYTGMKRSFQFGVIWRAFD